jgi:hypothetical protein
VPPRRIAKLLLLQRQTSASQPTQFVLIHPQERPGYFTEFRMNELQCAELIAGG